MENNLGTAQLLRLGHFNIKLVLPKLEGLLSIEPEDHELLGRGGGLVVSVLAFHSNDPSSIPAG